VSTDNETKEETQEQEKQGQNESRSETSSGSSSSTRSSRPRPPRRRRRRHDTYCPDGKCFDYKDVDTLRRYVTETGKIKPRRQTKNCSRCQRELAREVKRARHIALLPFVVVSE
jgi:small subunit ribosomal protein S18